MPDDAAKGFGRSASLDTAGAEGAKSCATAASHRTHRSTTALATTHTSAISPASYVGVWISGLGILILGLGPSRNLLVSSASAAT
jgi:hypothetical protein